MDKELNLKLKLKELYKEIENEVKLKIGDLMVSFNAQNIKSDDYPLNSSITFPQVFHTHDNIILRSLESIDDEANIAGYNFKNIDIRDINELKEGLFEIGADLMVEIRYEKEKDELSIYRSVVLNNNRKNQMYSIVFNYNQKIGSINLLSSSKILMRPL